MIKKMPPPLNKVEFYSVQSFLFLPNIPWKMIPEPY